MVKCPALLCHDTSSQECHGRWREHCDKRHAQNSSNIYPCAFETLRHAQNTRRSPAVGPSRLSESLNLLLSMKQSPIRSAVKQCMHTASVVQCSTASLSNRRSDSQGPPSANTVCHVTELQLGRKSNFNDPSQKSTLSYMCR